MTSVHLGLIGVLFAFLGSANAESRLAPLFKAVAKDPRAAEAIEPNISELVPAEEIPAVADAINTGNPTVMTLAISSASAILQIHKTDAEYPPNQRKLRPPLPQVIHDFHALLPVLSAHFLDEEPPIPGALSKDTYTNTPWRTHVVQFMNLLGAPPTSDMVAWMLQVLQWPKGRAEEYVARIERESVAPNTTADHDAFLRTTQNDFRADALNVAAVLAHLEPMPSPVLETLMTKIDDREEPRVAAEIIRNLADNKSLKPEVTDRLVRTALDKSASVDVRAAAIHAVGRLRPSDISKLSPLRGSTEDKIALALTDIGLQ